MKRKMSETDYRASRVCRILGNPTAYQIIKCLLKGEKTPTELAKEIGVSITTISDALRHLRNINIVRYKVDVNERIYWLKDQVIPGIISKLEDFVNKMRVKRW
jgi:transcription initiation factor IIE alpha subunit